MIIEERICEGRDVIDLDVLDNAYNIIRANTHDTIRKYVCDITFNNERSTFGIVQQMMENLLMNNNDEKK